ncbi:MAG: 2-C-methyl-D-erythritol 4-phosphate cytidylyltransferase [Candidatus Actinomarina sp.]|nr:2-C-methyl-D-erythritol 4-phosphate cytidylyltransferase [Candidatus Actinomarina sp.]MBL6763007.1 2-C-methyl-D-erythritol 4-phosphate cytidylyltransferase [Candidatus Actinomarina sp.]
MKVHAILLAGGSSDRFNNEENKVYFPIGGKPALSWALETLDNSDKVDSILLVVRDEDWDKTNNVIELVNPNKLSGVTIGGNTRHESEYQGLSYLKERPDVSEEDLILIHDGARPLLPSYLLDELINVAKKYGASAPGFNSKNLMKKKEFSKSEIQETIVEIQTPQIFPASELWKSYELAKLDNWQAVDTTECVSKYSELEAVVIPGDPRNMKVTFIEDIFKLEEMI